MDKNNLIELVTKLSDLPGAPGFEAEVARFIEDTTAEFTRPTQDKMHNLYLELSQNHCPLDAADRSKRLRLQLDAHMDEVAFMVSAIRDNGCLDFISLGSWVNHNIPAHRVKVRSRSGRYIDGLTTSKPPHFMSEKERNSGIALSDIVIDVGTSSRAETEALGLEIGAPVVPATRCEYFAEQERFIGKAFDCRVGCAGVIATLEQLQDAELELDVVAGLSTQEEVGTRGAAVTAQRIQADLAIVFEGCPADDTFAPPYKIQTAMGKGPMLRHIDARMITHPGFQRYALDFAEQANIPCQSSVRTGGSTNGAPIHLSNRGVPTIVIGIPVRYIHTSYGYLALSDLENAVRLAVGIIKSMDNECFLQL